jgi:hypothetical protein
MVDLILQKSSPNFIAITIVLKKFTTKISLRRMHFTFIFYVFITTIHHI